MKTRTWLGAALALLTPLILPLLFADGRVGCARLLYDHGPERLRGFAIRRLEAEGLRAAPELWDLWMNSRDVVAVRGALFSMTARAVNGGSGQVRGEELAALLTGVHDSRVQSKALTLALRLRPDFAVASAGLPPRDRALILESLAAWFAVEDSPYRIEPLALTLRGSGDHPRVFKRSLVLLARGEDRESIQNLARGALIAAEARGPEAFAAWSEARAADPSLAAWWCRASGDRGLFVGPEDLRRRAVLDRAVAAAQPALLDHRLDAVRLGFARLVARSSASLPEATREALLRSFDREDRYETEAMLQASLDAGLLCRPGIEDEVTARVRRGLASRSACARANAGLGLAALREAAAAHPRPEVRERLSRALSQPEGGSR